MVWKTWIGIEPEDTTDQTVQHLYAGTRDGMTGHVPDVVRLTSLTPKVARLLYDLNRTIHSEAEGLSSREQEIAALVVSSYNG